MKSCGGEREQPGGVTAADAAVGALVWVVRRNGSWWPGQILGVDELPEDCSIPPSRTVTPIKLLGRPEGSIDWYNLEKSKRVKPFRCGEFDEYIENAKVQQAHLQNISQNEGKYAHREYAIMHALEIEKSCFPLEGHLNTYGYSESISNQVSKPINLSTEYSKASTFCIRGHRRSKINISSLITPISKGSSKSDDTLLPLKHEGTMKCHEPDSDAVELEARVEGAACEPTDLENNTQVYDVKVTGNYTDLGLPLAFLTSKLIGNPIKGYPVSVDVLEDYCSAASIDDHLPATGNLECHEPDSDAVELEARVEGAACKPTDLENNTEVYDVEVTGNYTGLGLPLGFLTSKLIGNPIKGYPVSVEVLEDYCSAASIDDHLPGIGNLECLLKSRVSLPKKKRLPQSRPGVHKVNLHDLDKSRWPHAKKLAPDASPRKIQRLSSYFSNQRDQRLMQQGALMGLMSHYYDWQLHQEEEIEEDEEEVPPLHFAATSATMHAREISKQNPVVDEGSLLRTHSPLALGANCKPVENGSLPPTCSPLGSASSTREYHLRPMTIFSGSCSPPLSLSLATATRSCNGCPLYSHTLCSDCGSCRRSGGEQWEKRHDRQNITTTISHQASSPSEASVQWAECPKDRAGTTWVPCPTVSPLMLSTPVSESVLLDSFLLDGPAPPMIVDVLY